MCPRCKQPLLPQTRLCWSCGEDHLWAEGRATLEVQQLDQAQARTVVEMIAALVAEPSTAVATVVHAPPFELSSSAPAHLNRVAQLLSSRGAVVRTTAQPGVTRWRLRLRPTPAAGARFLTIAGMGASASWLELPVVAWAALVMAGLTLIRELELRPTMLEIDPIKGEQLEPLDSQLTQDLVRTRSGLRDAEVITGMGSFLGEYVSVATLLRAKGDHLMAGGKESDQRLRQLLRQALLMAVEAERCSQAETKAASLAPERLPAVRKLRADVLRHLDRLTTGLKEAQAQTLGLSPARLVTALDASISALHTVLSRLKAEAKSW